MLDRIPVIAIDPKGDLGNIMLTFPDLDGASFRPWVNPQAAAGTGKTVDELAAGEPAKRPGPPMGRKRTSVTSAVRKAGRMRKESSDAARAERALEDAELALAKLNQEFEAELAQVRENVDARTQDLDTITLRPKSTDVSILYCGIAWEPRIRKV